MIEVLYQTLYDEEVVEHLCLQPQVEAGEEPLQRVQVVQQEEIQPTMYETQHNHHIQTSS